MGETVAGKITPEKQAQSDVMKEKVTELLMTLSFREQEVNAEGSLVMSRNTDRRGSWSNIMFFFSFLEYMYMCFLQSFPNGSSELKRPCLVSFFSCVSQCSLSCTENESVGYFDFSASAWYPGANAPSIKARRRFERDTQDAYFSM